MYLLDSIVGIAEPVPAWLLRLRPPCQIRCPGPNHDVAIDFAQPHHPLPPLPAVPAALPNQGCQLPGGTIDAQLDLLDGRCPRPCDASDHHLSRLDRLARPRLYDESSDLQEAQRLPVDVVPVDLEVAIEGPVYQLDLRQPF